MIARSEHRQYFATFVLNLMCISFGGSCGWPSPAILELSSEKHPLLESGPITAIETSWIGSLVSLGGILGTVIYGSMVDRIGLKPCLLINAIPFTISWILILVAKDVLTLCISRLICGFGAGGLFFLTPMFIREISDDRIRGTLGSSIVLSCNIGILLMFILGNSFSFQIYSSVLLICPVSYFLMVLICLPETPKRLLAMNKFEAAQKSFQFYRNDKNYEIPYSISDASVDVETDPRGQNSLWDDLRKPSVRKAFLIGTVIVSFNQFCGLFTMLTFAGPIFKEAGSSFSPNMSSIIVGVIQLLGSYCSTVCVDRFGRKILLAGSGLGITVGLSGLGLYSFCKEVLLVQMEGLGWISLSCFCFAIFVGNCGIMALPFLIVSEIFPQRIAGTASMYCMVLLNAVSFLVLKLFPVVSEVVGPHYCFFFFACCAFGGALFSIFVMPETKGKSMEEIEKLMSK